jgi:oligopeptide/dipeptide ABC transporter ATP-binding protein
VDDLYENPQHPYTIGLLRAMPSLEDTDGAETLVSIEGTPPDLLSELTFCPFAPRCPYVFERCWQELPPPFLVGKQHTAACFYDIMAQQPR